jgi:hypothetical protein
MQPRSEYAAIVSIDVERGGTRSSLLFWGAGELESGALAEAHQPGHCAAPALDSTRLLGRFLFAEVGPPVFLSRGRP